jgi:hypothetical protein
MNNSEIELACKELAAREHLTESERDELVMVSLEEAQAIHKYYGGKYGKDN